MASNNTFLTAFGNGSQSHLKSDKTLGRLSAHYSEEQADAELRKSVAAIFGGDGASLQKSTSFNLDNVYGDSPIK